MLAPYRLSLTALLLAAPLWAAAPPARQPVKPLLLVEGRLTDEDPLDTALAKCRAKAHEVDLKKGELYLIEVRSDDFDTFLRVEDGKGNVLSQNYKPYQGAHRSRVIFTPQKDQRCRVIVTNTNHRGADPCFYTGAFVLHVDQLRARGAAKEVEGKLERLAETGGRHALIRRENWKAGDVYLVKARSKDVAPMLGVLGESDVVVGSDLNRAGANEAQVFVRAEGDGEHQVGVSGTKDVAASCTLSIQRYELTSGTGRTEREEKVLRAQRLIKQGSRRSGKEGFAEDKKALTEALALLEGVFPEKTYPLGHPHLVYCLNSLGVRLINQARYDEAVPHLQRARDSYESLMTLPVLPPTVLGLLASPAGYGPLLAASAAFPRRHRIDLHYAHPYVEGTTLHNLANALNGVGRPKDALPYVKELCGLRRTVVWHHVAFESQLLDLAQRVDDRRTLLLSISGQLPLDDDVYPLLFDSKAIHLRALQHRYASARAPRQVKKDLERRRLEQELIELKGELAALRREADPTDTKQAERIKQLTQRKEDLQLSLHRGLPTLPRHARLEELEPSHLDEHLRKRRAAFVDVMRYTHVQKEECSNEYSAEDRYVAFVLSGKGRPVRVDLGKAKPIDDAVVLWRQAVTGYKPGLDGKEVARLEAKAQAQADVLKRLVWAKLAKHLPANPTAVYLAVEGELTRMPFAVLPGSKKGQILLEELTIAQVPSGRFLLEQFEHPLPAARGHHQALVVGGVAYGGKDKAPPYPPLGGSALEIDELQTVAATRQSWWRAAGPRLDVVELRGGKATTAELRQRLPEARYAHLATHGFFDAQRAAEGTKLAQQKSQGRRFDVPTMLVGPGRWNPLVYAGLAFAGANAPAKDDRDGNVLSGEVIVELPLDRLHLAVLSACDTGLGERTVPEGVQGLQLAFHLGGCPNVVASLWKVNDAATALLMARFYHELWVNDRPPAEALRQAQLQVYHRPDLVREWAKKLPDWEKNRSVPQKRKEQDERLHDVLGKGVAPADASRTPAFLWAAFVLSGPGE